MRAGSLRIAGVRRLVLAAIAAWFAVAIAWPAVAQERVDLELVLAADGSGSIDEDELALQRRGYAEALTSPEVLQAIGSGPHGAIAVAYMEWGAPSSQVVIVDWAVIRDEASAADFAQKLVTRPRGAFGYNSISAAIDFSVRMINTSGFEGLRKVIDVSADAPNIGGRPVEAARDDAVADGITINALAIKRPGGGYRGPAGMSLESYMAASVIGGPGAFVEIADETRSFRDAVRSKLVLEIAGLPPHSVFGFIGQVDSPTSE